MAATKEQKKLARAMLKMKATKLVAKGIDLKLSVSERIKTAPKIEIKKDKQHTKSK